MKSPYKLLALLTLGLALGGCATQSAPKEAEEGGEKGAASLAKAPPAAQDAIKKVVGNHELKDVDSENDNGKTTWEAEYKTKKKPEYAVTVSDSGQILEHEVGVDMSAVPSAVLDAANKAHPDSKVGEVDIVSADGKMFYEMDIKAGDKKYEMKVNADGSVISDGIDSD